MQLQNGQKTYKDIDTSYTYWHLFVTWLIQRFNKKNQLLWGSWIQCYRVQLAVCFLLISCLTYPWTLKTEAVLCSTVTSVDWLLPDCTAVHSRTQCSSWSVLICFLLDPFSTYSLTLKMECISPEHQWICTRLHNITHQRIFFTGSVCTCLLLVPCTHTSILNTQAVLSSKTTANIY
jgi:hypothetical protein